MHPAAQMCVFIRIADLRTVLKLLLHCVVVDYLFAPTSFAVFCGLSVSLHVLMKW